LATRQGGSKAEHLPDEDLMDSKSAFTEHYISRGEGRVYAQNYDGTGPAFVLMHGFPDNLHIYDDLVPYLTAFGRRVVAFDFLGFGASDKPAGASYSFEQQLGDLSAVIQTLGLGQVVVVAHDSSGAAAINFAIEHPYKVASLCILNSAYDNSPLNVWPEMIVLFADPALKALALAVAQSPTQFGWLLDWQRQKFVELLPAIQKAHFEQFIGPLIGDNFIKQPSSGPAFMQMGAQFYEELKRNSTRLPLVKALDLPVKVIWGEYDPYLGVAMGRERATLFKNSSFHPVPAGHWLQSDMPKQVAELMLS
jgi:pimeloyl-ACP methyl ester carboxylesterase